MKKRIWIDTDGGVDDAFAIVYALSHPEINVRGISVVGGNVTSMQAYYNIRYLLATFGRDDIPVVPGESSPVNRPLITCTEVHGQSGMGWICPPPSTEYNGDSLQAFLALTDASEIITLGPLTNIAKSRREIESNPNIVSIHSMAGTIEQPNCEDGEYNLYVDPEAAQKVLDVKKALFFYGTELGNKVALPSLAVKNNRRDPMERSVLDLLLQWWDLKCLYDPMAVFGAIHQDHVEYKKIKVEMDKDHRGAFKESERGRDILYGVNALNALEHLVKVLFECDSLATGIDILSAHIDDSFLSVGGIVLRYNGKMPITVHNIFSRSNYTLNGTPTQLVPQVRELEERAVYSGLDVNLCFHGLDDWTLRDYRQWNEPPHEGEEYYRRLHELLRQAVSPTSVVLRPCGIGGCVDHALLCKIGPVADREFYYEDLPYADYPELKREPGFRRPYRVKISRQIEEKGERLRLYSSQLSDNDIRRTIGHSLLANGHNYEILWRK